MHACNTPNQDRSWIHAIFDLSLIIKQNTGLLESSSSSSSWQQGCWFMSIPTGNNRQSSATELDRLLWIGRKQDLSNHDASCCCKPFNLLDAPWLLVPEQHYGLIDSTEKSTHLFLNFILGVEHILSKLLLLHWRNRLRRVLIQLGWIEFPHQTHIVSPQDK